MRGTQKKKFIYKKCVFILTSLNFSHLQNTLHLMQYTYQDVFFTAQNSFWTGSFWCLLGLLQFLFHPFHIGRGFSFEEFCHPGKQKESLVAKSSRRIGRVGHRGHAILVQKLLNTQKGVGRCTSKSPIMKWAEVLKVFKKHSPKLSTASHNNVS